MNPPDVIAKIRSWQDELDAMIGRCEVQAGTGAGFLSALRKCRAQMANFLKTVTQDSAIQQGELGFSIEEAGMDTDIDTRIRKVRSNVQKLKLSGGHKNRTVQTRES